MSSWSRWLAVVALGLGIWHNVALIVLWWLASRSNWSVNVDFNTGGEALFEGLLAHLSLLILLLAFIVLVGSVRRRVKAARETQSGLKAESAGHLAPDPPRV